MVGRHPRLVEIDTKVRQLRYHLGHKHQRGAGPVFRPPQGPGTELKRLIAKLGLKPAVNCKCGRHIREMDEKGVAWCEQNIELIVGWLKEEALRARLLFSELGAKIIIRRAIRNAKLDKTTQKETVSQ